jgi:hypothetical protein
MKNQLSKKEILIRSIVDYDYNKIKSIIYASKEQLDISTNEILAKIDISEIEELLDSETVYFGVSRDVFITELKKKMLQFNDLNLEYKSLDDARDQFVIYCIEDEEEALNIELFFHEKEGKIIEIYNSFSNISDDDFDYLSYYQFLFYKDQLINFYPSEQYKLLSEQANKVFNSMINSNKITLTLKDVMEWLDENHEIWQQVEEFKNYYSFVDFHRLYSFFHSIAFEYINYLGECKNALSDFILNNCLNDNNNLLQWYGNYDRLKYEKVLGFNLFFDEFDVTKLEFRCTFFNNIFLKGDEFATIFNFNNLFDDYYHSYLDMLSGDESFQLFHPN